MGCAPEAARSRTNGTFLGAALVARREIPEDRAMPRPRSWLLVRPGHPGGVAGNDRSAERWRAQLASLPELVSALLGPFDPEAPLPFEAGPEGLLALHAEKSERAVSAFAARCPGRPILLALGGTDAYAEGGWSAASTRALDLATAILCFHELLAERLDRPAWRAKAWLLRPSAEPIEAAERAALCRPAPPFRALLLANLRAVKAPLLAALASELLPADLPLEIEHYGLPLDPRLQTELERLASPRCRFLGPLAPAAARQALARCHLLLNTSAAEGASNALVEALASGIPVLASRVPGNLGLLGPAHPGLFPPGDAGALAEALIRFTRDAHFRAELGAASRSLAPRHQPAEELASWRALLSRLAAPDRA
jgi:glycosyltransferase involved in cell wall biosynthesis